MVTLLAQDLNILFFLALVTPSQEFVPIFVVFSFRFLCFHSILLLNSVASKSSSKGPKISFWKDRGERLNESLLLESTSPSLIVPENQPYVYKFPAIVI
jgi:hypothetical protein